MERIGPAHPAERIPGWGSDADVTNRPGIPFPDVPHQRPGAHFDERAIPQQVTTVEVLRPPERAGGPTPVFGTANPPRGMSGRVKHLAYRYPDHLTRRWMLLLLSHRLDVLEARLERAVMPGVALTVAAGCLILLRRMWTTA
ncbi:MAG: hypothetical protein IRZ16_19855 [Myxococcaceae bacterium]|nr:hypothetical protein [Myxococcaceae bacterium]